jgi:hypothetical protein
VKTDALPLATAATTRITCGWCGAASTFAELLAASIDQSADARQLRERDFIRRC